MSRITAALAIAVLVPGFILTADNRASAQSLTIVDIRAAYEQHGATRISATKVPKILPGDKFYVEYAINGLKVDPKTGKASYETKIEFFDSKMMRLFQRKTPNEAAVELGGNQMPGDLFVTVGSDFDPGKYKIKLTVKDNLANTTASVDYAIEVLEPAFGFVQISAPGLGLPGMAHLVTFGITGAKLDAKKQPNVEVNIRILDADKRAVGRPSQILLPAAIPAGVNVAELKFVPMNYPMFLTRPGLFYIDISAKDLTTKKTINIELPLRVLDVGAATSGK